MFTPNRLISTNACSYLKHIYATRVAFPCLLNCYGQKIKGTQKHQPDNFSPNKNSILFVFTISDVTWENCSIITFIQPNIVPPFHGDQISEPLVWNLMGDCNCQLFLIIYGRGFWVVQQKFLIKREKSPVLHCSCGETKHKICSFGLWKNSLH